MNFLLNLIAIFIVALLLQAATDPKGLCITVKDQAGKQQESCFKITFGDNK